MRIRTRSAALATGVALALSGVSVASYATGAEEAESEEGIALASKSEDLIDIPDPNFRAIINLELGQEIDADITREQAENLEELWAGLAHTETPWEQYFWQVEDWSGIENFTNLTFLFLSSLNHIDSTFDLNWISGLTNLETLLLDYSNITDVSPLSGLTNLQELNIEGNHITDLSALPPSIKELQAGGQTALGLSITQWETIPSPVIDFDGSSIILESSSPGVTINPTNGNITANLPGEYELSWIENSGFYFSGSITVTVHEGDGEPPATPSIATSATTAVQGGVLTVTGSGLPAGASGEIWLHSDPVKLADITIAAEGTFSQQVTIPADTPAGEHTIRVLVGDAELEFEITITAADSDDDAPDTESGTDTRDGNGDSLAETGAGTLHIPLVAAFVLAGAAAVFASRRTAAHTQD